MSLVIYYDKSIVPKDMKIVNYKDCFRYFGEYVGSYKIIHTKDCVLCKMKYK